MTHDATEPTTLERPSIPMLAACGHPECVNPAGTNRYGLCFYHYDLLRNRQRSRSPSVPDSPTKAEIQTRRLAIATKKRMPKARTPLARPIESRPCVHPDCQRAAGTNTRQLCQVHNNRWRSRANYCRYKGLPDPPAVFLDEPKRLPPERVRIRPAAKPSPLVPCAVPHCKEPLGTPGVRIYRNSLARFGFEGFVACPTCYSRLYKLYKTGRTEAIAAVMRGESFPARAIETYRNGATSIKTSAQVCALLLLRHGDPNATEQDECRAAGEVRTRWEHLTAAEASRRIRRLYGKLDIAALCSTALDGEIAGDDEGED